jgi:DNA processing protein
MAATALRTGEEILCWLALRLTPGLGARKAVELLQRFGSPVPLFRSSASELMALGLPGAIARSIASGCSFEEASEQHELLLRNGAALIPWNDPLYPEQLREIYDPPCVLFARGRLELLDTVMVAVVGTRRPTTYGKVTTERLSGALAQAGVTVVSGMARGIDTAAHQAALDAGGGTVAVFGCGLDVIYPAENRRLAEEIAARGLLLSEYPFSTPAYPQNFPVRNRIVAGLAAGVLVVEGAQYSGSSITARLALDSNREVFAVPGNITSPMSFGPNLLIKQGATLVQDVNDILDALPEEDRRRLAAQRSLPLEPGAGGNAGPPDDPAGLPPSTAALHHSILSLLRVDEASHLDALSAQLLDWSPSEIIAALFDLELAGQIRQLPGKQYVRVWQG